MSPTEDQRIFARGVAQALAATNGDADDRLADLGWLDAFAEWGGTALVAVLGEQGKALASSTAVDDALTQTLGVEACGVLAPMPGAVEAPGTLRDALTVAGLGGRRLRDDESAVVVAADDAGAHRAFVVPLEFLTCRPVDGIDPDAGLLAVTGTVPLSALPEGAVVPWSHAVAVARVATAAELVGISRSMLQLAVDHALSRVQFGRPIAAFQAVRHRLADSLVAIESAASATAAAAESIGPDRAVSETHAAAAKALAGRGARLAAKHCQQVLAGVGFTAEHGFHRHFRRILLLDELWGSARTLTRELGRQAIDTGRLSIDLPL